MLEGTEKSVSLKDEESEDPTLVHKPHDEANEWLKTQVLQNIGPNFDVSSLHMFPVNQALWRTYMNSCMDATVRRIVIYPQALFACEKVFCSHSDPHQSLA